MISSMFWRIREFKKKMLIIDILEIIRKKRVALKKIIILIFILNIE